MTYREKLKNDPSLALKLKSTRERDRERERKQSEERKARAKIDSQFREQMRKKWREKNQLHRLKKQAENNISVCEDILPTTTERDNTISSRQLAGIMVMVTKLLFYCHQKGLDQWSIYAVM